MPRREWYRTTVVLSVFAVLFLTLTFVSFIRTSATFDEPDHLTSGYFSLKAKDYRVDPEHPPFLRMWAALPLLAQRNIKFPEQTIDRTDSLEWVTGTEKYALIDSFVYEINDADQMLYPARFMIALLGVLLGFLVFFWAEDWLGFWPAVFALACYTFEPNLLAHSSLVTTDLGVACFIFGAVYFLWRTTRLLSIANLLGLLVLFGLAAVSKFSALILAPIFLLLLAIRAFRKTPWQCKIGKLTEIPTIPGRIAASAALILLIAFASCAAIWIVYGFRYMPSASPSWRFAIEDNSIVRERAPMLAGFVHWVDAKHLLPNAYSEGFLLEQTKSVGRMSFLDGDMKQNGWWYYFPFAFLIKTPITLILLFAGGLILCAVKWKTFLANTIFVLAPLCIYAAVAISSDINIGLRHILPIYPFVILLAALCAAKLLQSKRGIVIVVAAALCLFWIFEFARAYPYNLAFFNSFVGGPADGYKYLADSNVDWGQDLKGLKRWMDSRNVKQINLVYFGTADPAYYGIQYTRLPGGTVHPQMQNPLAMPQLPGYVAISTTILDGVYLTREGRAFYAPLADREPVATIGHSINIYWAGDRWW
jgi:hypothetical protein